MPDPKETKPVNPEAPEAEGDTTDAPNPSTPEVPEWAADPTAAYTEVQKARQEAAKYRTQLREREEAEKQAAEAKRKAEQTAEERAKELEQKLKDAETAAEARVLTAERRAALAEAKVQHPDRVLKLMDDAEEYFDGSTPNVDAILKAFPEYAPKEGGHVDLPGARSAKGSGKLTMSDFEGKSEEWINANWHRLQQ